MYKITEHFYSLQGEGAWSGTPMYFFRLAQCPVGGAKGICRDWRGEEFVCDTGASYKFSDARVEHHPYTQVNAEFDAQDMWVELGGYATGRMCLTGGEPFIYDLEPLWETIPEGYVLHIETSGTIYKPVPVDKSIWLTVSPKWNVTTGMMERANEIKCLVGFDTAIGDIEPFLKFIENGTIVYLQPIEQASRLQRDKLMERIVSIALDLGVSVSEQRHKEWLIR